MQIIWETPNKQKTALTADAIFYSYNVMNAGRNLKVAAVTNARKQFIYLPKTRCVLSFLYAGVAAAHITHTLQGEKAAVRE